MADGPLKIQLVVDKAGPDLYCGRTGDFPDLVALAPTIEGVIARAPYAITEYLQANKIFGPVDLTVLVIKSFQVMVNPPAPPRPPGQRPAGQAPGPRPPGAPGAPRPPGAPPPGGPRPPGAQAGGPRPPGAPPGAPAKPAAPPRPKIKMLTILPPGTIPLPPEAEEPTSPSAATTASTPTVAKP